ncbi:MAG: DUF3089 domain-containing protein [Phenylobacterium sp.]|nr:MAG: DUF3089 domain-containing protein [Phenylobacterium sp.]
MALKVLAALGLSAGMMLVAGAAAAQTQGLPKNDYGDKASWLCRPDKIAGNACKVDLSTTVVQANGKESVEAFHADPKAPIDCFYVYPTVSNDPGVISDMNPGSEETNVVKVQFARLGAKCRLYAPMYRQITLTALRAGIAGKPLPGQNDPAMRTTGYNDVVDAWNYYLAHDNHGRGVVLVGHSQGSGVLTQVIKNEIDGKPVQARLVSAILMGTRLPVDKGKDLGLFQHVPLCKSAAQVGCVIAYASFRDTVPPPANSRFGKAPNENQVAACTNPAALGGGKGELHAYLSNSAPISGAAAPKTVWVKGKPNPTTPFISVPGLLTSECVEKNGFSYMEVHVNAVPADPRTDSIEGDVVLPGGQVSADWGLHLIDANLAMGNLVHIVGEESKAWIHGKP